MADIPVTISPLERRVQFAVQGIEPPSFLYVNRDDRLLSTDYSDAALDYNVSLRILRPDGQVVTVLRTITSSGTRAGQDTFLDLTEGYLLQATAYPTGAVIQPGRLYVRLMLWRGDFTAGYGIAVLLAGYIQTGRGVNWPFSDLHSALAGPGQIRQVAGADPGLGVEASVTVPTNARWRLMSFLVRLVTSGVGAARQVQLVIDDGVTIGARVNVNGTQGVGLTRDYCFFDGAPSGGLIDVMFMSPLIGNLVMHQSWRVRTVTTNIDGGDNYGIPQVIVEEWISV